VSGVAAVTERVEIGTIVLCTSFRNPGLTAKMAATGDEVSDGRLILRLGAGWHDPEYDAFGYARDRRVDRFEEALQVIAPLLRGERVTFEGRYERANDAELAPAPKRPIPIRSPASGEGFCDSRRATQTRTTRPGTAHPTSASISSWPRSTTRSRPRAETRPR
jgi:alkanesulfonate monooxygenase SsuD/methylene tetrahydromethanopterin reductase-like flavin-dependent oxidoreductase (luciferase family)